MPTVTRRKRLLALAAALVALGCSRIEVSKSEAPRAAQPGVLRMAALAPKVDNLNTVLSGGGISTYLSFLWAAYLYLADDKGNLQPELATEVPTLSNGGISRDGLRITYHLRRGVQWHDGAPFDARDVIFTWRAIMNPKNNVPTRLGYEKIASIAALDPYTVRVQLKQPYSPAVASIFGPGEVPMPILPRHILGNLPDINQAAYNSKPIGTGPFIIDRYEPSTGVFLKANPHYWRGKPKLRAIDYLFVSDPNTAIVMLQSRELDVIYPTNTHAVELAHEPGIAIVSEPANQVNFLQFNVAHPPLDDVRVRRAIATAVDRKFFFHAFQHDIGSLADSDQPPFLWSFDPHVREPDYDLSRAARLLDEAGWHEHPRGHRSKNGERLALTFVYESSSDDGQRYGAVFFSVMRKLGIDVTIRPFPYNIFYAQKNQGGILNGGRYDVAFSGWVGGVDPDDATLWMCNQWPPQGYNSFFLCDQRIDAQERVALTAYDVNTRRRAYWRIQGLLAEDVPAVFLAWVDIIYAIRDDVKDFEPGENYWGSWNWRKE